MNAPFFRIRLLSIPEMSGITCSDCLTGFVKGGTPTGTVTTVHGLPTYITRPSQEAPNGVIILLPDIFGWEMSNARLLADTYAKQGGYLVYLPNFMNRGSCRALGLPENKPNLSF